MLKITEEASFEDHTLIIPSVAVGNVAQLCADLLISSLTLKRVGSVLSESFVPIVGLDPYDLESNSLCTAIDVYADSKRKLVLLQIRSSYVGGTNEFFEEIARFIEENQIAKTIILTSSYDYEKAERSDPAVVRYMTTENLSSADQTAFHDLSWKKHEKKPLEFAENPRIPGGGFANGLFAFCKNRDVKCAVIFRFCYEGDNVPDALDFTARLNQWLRLLESNEDGSMRVKIPPSWEHLFGNPPASEIY